MVQLSTLLACYSFVARSREQTCVQQVGGAGMLCREQARLVCCMQCRLNADNLHADNLHAEESERNKSAVSPFCSVKPRWTVL